LVGTERDFKIWCHKQFTLLNETRGRAQEKVDNADDLSSVDLDFEATLLESSFILCHQEMKELQAEIEKLQLQLGDCGARMKSLEEEIEAEKYKSDSGVLGSVFVSEMFGGVLNKFAKWANPEMAKFYNRFDGPLEQVGRLSGILNKMEMKAQDDYALMGKVRRRVAEVNEVYNINDPEIFKEVTLRDVTQLVNLLGKLKDRQLSADKMFK